MAPTKCTLAALGGRPAFPPSDPVPLIYTQGYGVRGDFSAIDAILTNETNEGSRTRSSQQRFIAKILPGVEAPGPSYRVTLQSRIREFLELDHAKSSVICVSSGTNALRAVLRGVCAADRPDDHRDEVIVPQITVGATVEAVIAEGFKPIFTAVDPDSWHLSLKDIEHSISQKTAAIITVDWLGTQCDLTHFRRLADKHDIKLISDSAQSFGASDGTPPSVNLAHATIYSLGYPKVLTGAGSGGLIVCTKSLKDLLANNPTGILRHEALAEINAFACLRALEVFPTALKTRREAGQLYRQLLAGVPGVAFQKIPPGSGTNYYQMSLTIDTKAFGLDAKGLCEALRVENIRCSTDRMPCVAANADFAHFGRVAGSLEHSQRLGATSITLPISNTISLDVLDTICGLVKLIQKGSQEILGKVQRPRKAQIPWDNSYGIVDLESKFRQHLNISILDSSCVHSKLLIPHESLRAYSISIDEFLERFKSQRQWTLGEYVCAGLRVDAIIGAAVIIVSHDAGHSPDIGKPVSLVESGSSANVTLVPQASGLLSVHKTAAGYGIDGNGAPWLRRQSLFLEASRAVKKTSLFVKPTDFIDNVSNVTLVLPYIPSHSLGELIFANVGAELMVEVIVGMLSRMATSVWTESQEEADPCFIQKAHFDRMKRRLEIARVHDDGLNKILDQKTVMLNGRLLDGFSTVVEKLERHPMLAKIMPTTLGEIHGDLNIHNVLSRLDLKDSEPLALIDPRGVPLLGKDIDKAFERGDYCYDISKLLFSLTGFSEIRRQLYDYSVDGDSHMLTIRKHPGSPAMNGLAHLLIPELAASKEMVQWIQKVERYGVWSFELRVRVGEAAHFVADCACALGRNTPWEIIPLFLMGLKKLNDLVKLLDSTNQQLVTRRPRPCLDYVPTTADFGVALIQRVLFSLRTAPKNWPYDVLEFSVKAESASTLQQLLRQLVGTYLPEGTAVYLSTDPIRHIEHTSPCMVLIHSSNGVRGQTHMFLAAMRRTTAFFRDNGMSQNSIRNLRIVHVSSTGSSSRSQFTARDNDKLLSPGSFGISPLKLALTQSVQLPFPKPGRWVVENDSFFLLGQPLAMSGDELCLLAIERPTSQSISSWRVCIDRYEKKKDLLLARGIRNIEPHEKGRKLLRTTTGLFMPNHLAEAMSCKERDYALRASPLIIDIVLPRFMEREEWIRCCHKQGFGIDSHLVWQNAEDLKGISDLVELADGGDAAYYHYGSDGEYHTLLANVVSDTRLNSLAYVRAAVEWQRRFTKVQT